MTEKARPQAHNKPSTMPDLGVLIDWLLERAEAAEQERDALRSQVAALTLTLQHLYTDWQIEARHRSPEIAAEVEDALKGSTAALDAHDKELLERDRRERRL
jgi:hypothetical protein